MSSICWVWANTSALHGERGEGGSYEAGGEREAADHPAHAQRRLQRTCAPPRASTPAAWPAPPSCQSARGCHSPGGRQGRAGACFCKGGAGSRGVGGVCHGMRLRPTLPSPHPAPSHPPTTHPPTSDASHLVRSSRSGWLQILRRMSMPASAVLSPCRRVGAECVGAECVGVRVRVGGGWACMRVCQGREAAAHNRILWTSARYAGPMRLPA